MANTPFSGNSEQNKVYFEQSLDCGLSLHGKQLTDNSVKNSEVDVLKTQLATKIAWKEQQLSKQKTIFKVSNTFAAAFLVLALISALQKPDFWLQDTQAIKIAVSEKITVSAEKNKVYCAMWRVCDGVTRYYSQGSSAVNHYFPDVYALNQFLIDNLNYREFYAAQAAWNISDFSKYSMLINTHEGAKVPSTAVTALMQNSEKQQRMLNTWNTVLKLCLGCVLGFGAVSLGIVAFTRDKVKTLRVLKQALGQLSR